MSIKLYYFNAEGRAEVSRWICAQGDIKYEDVRFEGKDWPEFKPKTPLGQLPVLEIDGRMIAQSNAIARCLARRAGLYGKTDEEKAKIDMVADTINDMMQPVPKMMFEKNEETKAALLKKWKEEEEPKFFGWFETVFLKDADKTKTFLAGTRTLTYVDLFFVCCLESLKKVSPPDLRVYPRIKALQEHVLAQPKIAKWIEQRPKSSF